MTYLTQVLDALGGPAGYYLLTLFGSAVGHVFAVFRGFNGAGEFLRRVLPGRPDHTYERVNFVIIAVVGSVLGYCLFAPATAYESLAAGFGWVGAMNTLAARGPDQSQTRPE